MDEQKITHSPSIRLTRGMANKYSWEIKIDRENLEEAILEIEKINNQMLKKFKKEGEKK